MYHHVPSSPTCQWYFIISRIVLVGEASHPLIERHFRTPLPRGPRCRSYATGLWTLEKPPRN